VKALRFPRAGRSPVPVKEISMLHLLQRIHRREEGQGTVEYVLVILAAAAIALSLIAWIGDTDLFSGLFGTVLKKVIGFAK